MFIGINTINDDNNYGNRLQNYALSHYLNQFNYRAVTIKFKKKLDFKRIIKIILNYKGQWRLEKRYKNFKKFNKNICFETFSSLNDKKLIDKKFYITGSDQVWNPYFDRLSDIDLLCFAESSKRISYAASFGVDELPDKCKDKIRNELNKFKAVSVREDKGKEIVENITGRTDVEVLIDPTMLLGVDDWDKILKKPIMLKSKKYILNYFLGNLSTERKNEIERIAEENNCKIINILDKNSPFYECGPSEFLYLEKHAFLICTDSFHSSVFAILYNRPFIVFEREQNGIVNMNSRLKTLLQKFNLKNREFNGKITNENINHDYTEAYQILENERQKSKDFLERALNIKK